jgi:hypothetical protein
MPDENGVIEIKDFTLPAKPKHFKIGSRMFIAVEQIPLGLMEDLVDLASTVGAKKNLDAMFKFFDAILVDDSATLMREGLHDKVEPIGAPHIIPLMHWLMEEYGFRPTEPSETSSNTSDVVDASTSSTDGVSVEA